MSTHFWSTKVKFNATIKFYKIERTKDKENENYFQIALDRRRREPRFINIFAAMTSVQNLLRDVSKRQSITVVFGNMGRLPHLLSYYVDVCFEPTDEIRVFTEWDWEETQLDESYEDDGTRCDVLIVVEPKFGATIEKPCYAKRLIVLTSHLNCDIKKTLHDEKLIVAHHVGNIHQFPIPISAYVDHRLIDQSRDFTYEPSLFLKSHVEIPEKSNVCVDLSKCRDWSETYLKLLNACDVLRFSSIETWTVSLKSSIKRTMKRELLNLQILLKTKYYKMACNVDGINLMRMYYIEQFLLK